jgi:hypothetical protein
MKRRGIWCERDVHFAVKAQEATLLDYLHEVEHMAARIVRLDSAIEEAVKVAPAKMRGDRRAASLARNRADIGGDHRGCLLKEKKE